MAHTLLWWGKFDAAYSRNGVLRDLLRAMGWQITDFHPLLSQTADIEASLRRVPRPAAVWVPCFRQRDIAAAARWARRKGVPLVFDPLISAYDKQVFERRKFAEDSAAARTLLMRERREFSPADLVIADTTSHAAFFRDTLGVPAGKLAVVYVGAEEALFKPAAKTVAAQDVEVLFYGSYIPLHGAETIVEAARRYDGPAARWVMLGSGPALGHCKELAEGVGRLTFEPPIPYARLCGRIQQADILLGVFGTTPKAGRVMPNKVFQSLAAGRPVLTRESDAYPAEARASEGLGFVPPGDPSALAAAVARWAGNRDALARRGTAARELYEKCFSASVIRKQLDAALSRLFAF
jgi:glycosyltransferase involved in cell wall biosynthesis